MSAVVGPNQQSEVAEDYVLVSNPETFPIGDSEAALAETNVRQLLQDCGLDGHMEIARSPADDNQVGDGRYAYLVTNTDNGKNVLIHMPGWPTGYVRFTWMYRNGETPCCSQSFMSTVTAGSGYSL
jgi:hypothetical protein